MSVETWINAHPIITMGIILTFVGGAIYVVYRMTNRKPDRFIHVFGYDTETPHIEYRQVPLYGKEAIWEVQENPEKNVAFRPSSSTVHSATVEGEIVPCWLLDLNQGRTMKIEPDGNVARTSGQELYLAMRDTTVRQWVNAQEDIFALLIKMAPVFGAVVIALLVIIAIMQFV